MEEALDLSSDRMLDDDVDADTKTKTIKILKFRHSYNSVIFFTYHFLILPGSVITNIHIFPSSFLFPFSGFFMAILRV